MAIEEYAANLFGCSVEELFTPSRKREVINARQVCMRVMRERTTATTTTIGAYFNRDHATVIASNAAFKNQYETDRHFRTKADQVMKESLEIPFTLSHPVYSGCKRVGSNLLLL